MSNNSARNSIFLSTDFYKFEGNLAAEPIVNFMRHVGKNCTGKVIDVGCGKMPYRSFFPNVRHYTGVDRVKPPSYSADADFVIADINELPFGDSQFDVALSNQVLEHVPDPKQLLKEMHRVLVNGGTLFLTAPQMEQLHAEPHDYYRFTKHGLKILLEQHGFRIEFIESQGGFWRAIGSHFNFYFVIKASGNAYMKAFVRRALIPPISLTARILERLFYWDLDTLGYNVIAKKI